MRCCGRRRSAAVGQSSCNVFSRPKQQLGGEKRRCRHGLGAGLQSGLAVMRGVAGPGAGHFGLLGVGQHPPTLLVRTGRTVCDLRSPLNKLSAIAKAAPKSQAKHRRTLQPLGICRTGSKADPPIQTDELVAEGFDRALTETSPVQNHLAVQSSHTEYYGDVCPAIEMAFDGLSSVGRVSTFQFAVSRLT